MYEKRSLFPFFLASAGTMTYVFATNPGVNSTFPFVDGLRLLPSFFIPVFFLSGIGAAALLGAARRFAEGFRTKAGMDSFTFAVAFMLAISLPLASLFAVVAVTTTNQYVISADSLQTAAEYSSLREASSIIGPERVYFVPGVGVSQYPIYDQGFESTVSFYSSPNQIASAMENAHLKYLLLGNADRRSNSSDKSRADEYLELKGDPRFSEVQYGGISPAVHPQRKPPAPASDRAGSFSLFLC